MVQFRSPVMNGSATKLNRYGGRHNVTVLPGDGIGPEMLEHVETIFKFAQVPVDFESVQLSSKPDSENDLEQAIMAIKRNGVALKVFGEIQVCLSNLVCIIFNLHTILIFSTPELQVSRPQQFDIMLMPNLYGNIISNIACGLVGGPGLVSGMNIGDEYAVFETGTRNTGTTLAGKNLANPTAFIRASADMLRASKLFEVSHEFNFLLAFLCFSCLAFDAFNHSRVQGTRNTGTTLTGKDLANPTAFIRASADMLRWT
ncbi:unnamed protein product [Strongylus vulgaris]|uniref:Isopropylmalate dehydrogenase-like domain-containing protein n=1 Tax=Strongylus vulgaris TaxID=40348 RepID=A0A3P7JQL2_STRVU|nr:unnamed protein product [Strongylus vulgaris]